jgi:hypothetical protein
MPSRDGIFSCSKAVDRNKLEFLKINGLDQAQTFFNPKMYVHSLYRRT